MPKPCVFGRATNDATRHSFPNPRRFRQHFNAWVNITGDFGMSSEEIFKKKKVCDAHFTERDRSRNHRLNNLAIPSLHLNGFHGKLTIATSATVAQKPEMDTQYVAGLNNQRDHSKATYSRTGTVEKMHIGCSSIIAHNAIAPAFTPTDRTESQVQKMVPTGGCSEHFPVTVDHDYCKKAEKG
ncbi:uncharacterized protein LOC105384263 [Plutella xylostella]|uniref:uncharacterized protein LOC105384263 n=1 Tax=Plutella xylostella TaxID=51655 RepID=UPI0020329D92|nr:uncharacterized protein LOC105384263 [Plutella xylostella]